MKRISKLIIVVISIVIAACTTISNKQSLTANSAYTEEHRPQIHFSPPAKWMNDPNGMVFHNGVYHLFYQYYPDSTVWGPMHWGHATSKDLVHWAHQPIALYPDSLGYIFSGSAVVDNNNTTGFGRGGKAPLVAIFTHHDPVGEKAGKVDYQHQSIAYSLDDGKTWTKYAGNPVLKNPGIKDFRDAKVSWYAEGNKWIMTLATLDRITFYTSTNLKDWTKESEFGATVGAHGGVWECPDLFPLTYNGQTHWVLLVSINPGGPNGGSATQYFVGQFDGKTFTPYQTDTRWIDYGPDNYAGVTWFGTGDRKIFLGWMSNWQYATVVPTEKWRSAMTVPRELGLEKIGERYLLSSKPVKELNVIEAEPTVLNRVEVSNFNLTERVGTFSGPGRLTFTTNALQPFTLTLFNKSGDQLTIGYDAANNQYFMDRTKAGKVSFEKGFAARHTAPRLSNQRQMDCTLIFDEASVELFADNGLTAMTQTFFPNRPFTDWKIEAVQNMPLETLRYQKMRSIWR